MITITKANVIELLERAVAEKGADYIDPSTEYDNCSYLNTFDDTSNDKPGCIVGHVLHYAGADADLLHRWDANVSGLTSEQIVAADEFELEGVMLDLPAFTALMTAQNHQDKSETWGRALEAAKRVLSHEVPA